MLNIEIFSQDQSEKAIVIGITFVRMSEMTPVVNQYVKCK